MLDAELNKWLNVCAVTLKGTSPKDLTGEIVSVWLLLLEKNRVLVEDLAPVFTKILERETFFPTPAEFLNRWRKHVVTTRPAFALRDPVTIANSELGVPTLAERDKVDPALVLDDERPCLPVTDEQRWAAMERVENLPVVQLAKQKRMKAADLLASDKRIQAMPEPTPEEIEAKKAELRRQASVG